MSRAREFFVKSFCIFRGGGQPSLVHAPRHTEACSPALYGDGHHQTDLRARADGLLAGGRARTSGSHNDQRLSTTRAQSQRPPGALRRLGREGDGVRVERAQVDQDDRARLAEVGHRDQPHRLAGRRAEEPRCERGLVAGKEDGGRGLEQEGVLVRTCRGRVSTGARYGTGGPGVATARAAERQGRRPAGQRRRGGSQTDESGQE